MGAHSYILNLHNKFYKANSNFYGVELLLSIPFLDFAIFGVQKFQTMAAEKKLFCKFSFLSKNALFWTKIKDSP